MAREAGIDMTESRLYHEGGRSHFMTKRFDRNADGSKIHMQSLGAMAHVDFNQPASYSYEQALQTMKKLGLSRSELDTQVLRTMFNVVARNQDDHVKNIAFLMNRSGEWRLSPAFDVTYAFNPDGDWTGKHQMSINGKRDDFTKSDLLSLAKTGGMKESRANEMIEKVIRCVSRWPECAERAGVSKDQMRMIKSALRLSLPS